MQRIVFFFLFYFCLINSLQAQGNWFGGGSLGATFPNVSHNDYISPGPGWPNDRYTNHNVGTTASLALQGGYQWAFNHAWLPFFSLGASYNYMAPVKVTGKVDQYSLPEFENYNYQYKIQSQMFLAFTKLDLYRWRNLMPFLLAGAGVSLNNASNYVEQAVPDVTARVSPGFKGSTNTFFSFVLGAGFDFFVQEDLLLSLQYEYAHQGYAQTGPGVDLDLLTDTNYSTDHLKTKLTSNSVLFSLIYLFC